MKTSSTYDATQLKVYCFLMITFIGSASSYPSGDFVIHVIESDPDKSHDIGIDKLTTEQYVIRTLIIAALVLMGGFFAGTCAYRLYIQCINQFYAG